ncbi:DUF2285 domain-containing protein [Pelagibacterium luteolum]|uniref:Uncharacterized conserved protein n=1 Tax=Pelagibacterium luteolum TaxID=440168 RepID=A0A1G7YK26_9HYPH|nr:DUF2285 domain-containing protein [Pelagibacterium luteolum]SDG96599.1 Uncharacterized conserved protein [Pelagibacterium luteolum]
MLIVPAPPGFAEARALPVDGLPDLLARSDDGDGCSAILIDIHGPHRLRIEHGADATGWAYVIPDDPWRMLRLHALHRLLLKLAGLPTGMPPPMPGLTPYRLHRLALALRALDGEEDGASRREIGAVLFAGEARGITAHDWKSSGLRKKVARLIRLGRVMRGGGYRHLLTRSFDRIRWN